MGHHRQNHKILVIDEDETSGEILGAMLKACGHEVLVVINPEAAIDEVTIFAPDIVLLDVGPPITNGFEICGWLRRKPIFKDVVFIAQTGWEQEKQTAPSEEVKIDHHLGKPINIEELKGIIEKLVF